MNWSSLTGLLVSAVIFLAFLGSCMKKSPEQAVKPAPDPVKDDALSQSETIPVTLTEANLVSASGEKDILIGSGKNLLNLEDGRHVKSVISLASEATALNRNGDLIYAALGDHIEVFSKDGSRTDVWPATSSGGLITGLAVSAEGVWAADSSQKAVFLFSFSGQVKKIIDGKSFGGFTVPSAVFDVAAAPDGTVWITNPGKHQVMHFDGEGRVLGAFGSPSLDWYGFNACCNPMRIALLPDGRIVTAEKGRIRVKVFTPDGKLDGIIGGTETFGFGTKRLSLSVGSDGSIYIADPVTLKVKKFTKIRKPEEFNAG